MKSRDAARKYIRGMAGLGIAGVFILAIMGSARLGTNAALSRMPEEARRGVSGDFSLGIDLVLGTDGEPVFLSRSVQPLRNFFFANPDPASRRAAETESTALRRFVGEIRVRTVRHDADLMNVEVLSGALNGDSYWIHVEQLPDPETAGEGKGGEQE